MIPAPAAPGEPAVEPAGAAVPGGELCAKVGSALGGTESESRLNPLRQSRPAVLAALELLQPHHRLRGAGVFVSEKGGQHYTTPSSQGFSFPAVGLNIHPHPPHPHLGKQFPC